MVDFLEDLGGCLFVCLFMMIVLIIILLAGYVAYERISTGERGGTFFFCGDILLVVGGYLFLAYVVVPLIGYIIYKIKGG